MSETTSTYATTVECRLVFEDGVVRVDRRAEDYRGRPLHFRFGWRCRRPLIGVEFAPYVNGMLLRFSLWPNRYGFTFSWWRE